jgi:hypothetical protein
MARLEWLTCGDFSGHLGERFEVTVADQTTLALELVEAVESTALGGLGPEGQERLQFSLVFRGPATPNLGQGTRRLRHDELEELDLFLVPIGPDAEGMRYEAVFA